MKVGILGLGFGIVSGTNTPGMTQLSFIVRDANMAPRQGATFTFVLIDPKADTDAWSQQVVQGATSDVNGFVQINLAVSMRWRMIGPDGKTYFDFTTNAGPTFQIPAPGFVGTF